jgi:hypothetical protein
MKYRTKAVRLRQKLLTMAAILLTISATSLVSMNAIDQIAAQEQAAAQEANEGGVDQVITSTDSPGLWVTGDSVILGIRNVLAQYERIELINARVGRQIGELIEVAKTDQQFVGNSPVVLNLGNNNRLIESDVISLMEIVKNQPRIIVVNTAVPRSWKDLNNELIRKIVSQYPNATIIDWDQISTNHPEYFATDGVHLNPPGVNAYVSAIREVLQN